MIKIISDKIQAKYVFDVMFSRYEINYTFDNNKSADLTVSYGKLFPKINGKCIHIFQSDFWDNYKKKQSFPKIPLKHFFYNSSLNDIVLLFCNKNKEKEIIKIEKKQIIINFDIIASIFFYLTRYEEYMQPEIKDDYNRFPAKASISFQENFLNKAVVDEYIEMFFDLIKKIKPDLVIKRKKFKIIVSHDVDYFLLNYKFPIKNLLGDLYKRKNIKLFLNRISIFYNTFINYKKDPYWMFDYFIRKEKNGVSSVFFFLMDKIPENNYNIKDRRLIELIRNLQNKKIEIGLHGSFLSSNNKDYLKKEKELLEIIIGEKKYGVRQHFLGFNVKKTWKIQNDLGFKYDTSCGFPDYEGFRCGTCHPFKIYDLENDCVLDLVEIPLIVMDGTLRDYQKYSPIKAIEVIQNLKKTCKKHDGVFTILWHNSFFYNNEEWKEVYEESIKLI